MEAILAPTENWDMFQPGFGAEGRKLFQAFRTPDVGWDLIVNKNIFIEEILPKIGTVRRLRARPGDGILQRSIQKTRI
jgi:hypothetical protein